MTGTEHEVAGMEGNTLTCTCGETFTADKPWAALMEASRHAAAAELVDVPEALERPGDDEPTPNHQEEDRTHMNATPTETTPKDTSCPVVGCTGAPSYHFGPHLPLHSTSGFSSSDPSWSVSSHRVDDSLWEVTTIAGEDQTPENAEAIAIAVLLEARIASNLNLVLRSTVFA